VKAFNITRTFRFNKIQVFRKIHETFDKPGTNASEIGPPDSMFAAAVAGDNYDDTIMQHARYINDE
jgi:hypothetical protein